MKSEGYLFSELYLDRLPPSQDSRVFRARIGYFLDAEIEASVHHEIARAYKLRKGVNINYQQGAMSGYYQFEQFLEKCSIPQALDLITISGNIIRSKASHKINTYEKFVRAVFLEENLQYTLDTKCGVHPLIDQEFQHAKNATIAALDASSQTAARHEFEKCFDFITATNPDFKSAIRSVFECAEIIVKDALNSQNLSKYVVNNVMATEIKTIYLDDAVSQKVAEHLLSQLVSWVEACHFYRHGQVTNEPLQPAPEIAILLISVGASLIRWLLDILPKIRKDA